MAVLKTVSLAATYILTNLASFFTAVVEQKYPCLNKRRESPDPRRIAFASLTAASHNPQAGQPTHDGGRNHGAERGARPPDPIGRGGLDTM